MKGDFCGVVSVTLAHNQINNMQLHASLQRDRYVAYQLCEL